MIPARLRLVLAERVDLDPLDQPESVVLAAAAELIDDIDAGRVVDLDATHGLGAQLALEAHLEGR